MSQIEEKNPDEPQFGVNYSVDFAINVSGREIDLMRKKLIRNNSPYRIWDLTITKESSDEDIAKVIAVLNFKEAQQNNMDIQDTVKY